MTVDINSLSLKELKDLQSQVAKAIASIEDRKKKEALAELTGLAVTRKRAPATAKYANPANSSDTWSGRGRKPRWFVAALAAGKAPEDLAL